MPIRSFHRRLIASATLVLIGQLVMRFVAGRTGPDGITEALRFVIGGSIALLLFATAFGLALLVRVRSRTAPKARRIAGWLLLAALAVPIANAIHLFWWPTPERLVRAAREGDLNVVKRCLFFGIDPDATGMRTLGFGGRAETETPLTAAVITGKISVVQRLLDAGADPAVEESAALVAALNSGRPEIVDVLLSAGAPTEGVLEKTLWNAPDHDRRRFAALKRVLSTKIAIEPAWLHLKAMFLIENDFGIAFARAETEKAQRARPRVALLNAIALSETQGSERAVRLYRKLRGQFAKPASDDATRTKALAQLVSLVGPSAQNLPLGQITPEVLLALAAKFGAAALVEALLADGVPVEPPDTDYEHPRSPLGYAAAAGHVEAARALVKAGADVTRSDSLFGTPLHGAAANGSLEIVDLLVAHGAAPDAPRSEGVLAPPSHAAAWKGDLSMVQILLAHGARLDADDDSGRTLRSIASERKHSELQAFLDAVAD